MTCYVLSVISICFCVGALAVALVNKRKGGSVRERWIKYFSYLIIVYSVAGIIIAGEWYFAVLAIIIGIAGYCELFITAQGKGNVRLLAGGLTAFTFILIGFTGLVLVAPPRDLLAIYFLVILFDGFSQLSGQLFGRRKLAPVISPNKTVEGFIGGWAITMLCSVYLVINYYRVDIVQMICWVGACPAALAGDLAASYYKRRAGVKDYSNLIPGHGGVLDRFDSLLAVYAFCYFASCIVR